MTTWLEISCAEAGNERDQLVWDGDKSHHTAVLAIFMMLFRAELDIKYLDL